MSSKAKDLGKRYLEAAVAFIFAQVVAGLIAGMGNFSTMALAIAAIADIVMVAGIIFYLMESW